jgi:hypothetical protein
MKKIATFTLSLLILLVPLATVLAQSDPPAEGNPAFTQAELDQMLAPIALYPDELLSQVLMAATYPLEVVEAARWSSAHPGLKGDVAVQAVDNEDWDPSVKSLVAFPEVLETLDQKIEWTERLGDAFLAQQSQVMDTVQGLRTKAQQAGNLSSNAQVDVTDSDDAIEIEPANPEVVYVPYYDPAVVYGSWWWPAYPPVFWAPWPDYGWYSGFGWGAGFTVGVDFFFGGWDWRHHRVFVHDGRHRFPPGRGDGGGRGPHTWQHDPDHRHGVPYRNGSLNRQFGRAGAPADARRDFRGHQALAPGRALGPDRGLAAPARQNSVPPRIRATNLPDMGARQSPHGPGRGFAEPRPQAFEGIGRGGEVRGFSARGQESVRSAPARSESQHSAPSHSGPSHR